MRIPTITLAILLFWLPAALAEPVLEAFANDSLEPAFSLPDLKDGIHELQDYRGKVVLVNFWATWCPYCRHEMPAMEDYYRAHKGRGFAIVAYSTDKTQQEVDDFMAREGYTFPAPLAPPGVAEAFGGVDRLPTSFVIDRQGRIRHKVSGQVHAGRLEDLIGPLLAESP